MWEGHGWSSLMCAEWSLACRVRSHKLVKQKRQFWLWQKGFRTHSASQLSVYSLANSQGWSENPWWPLSLAWSYWQSRYIRTAHWCAQGRAHYWFSVLQLRTIMVYLKWLYTIGQWNHVSHMCIPKIEGSDRTMLGGNLILRSTTHSEAGNPFLVFIACFVRDELCLHFTYITFQRKIKHWFGSVPKKICTQYVFWKFCILIVCYYTSYTSFSKCEILYERVSSYTHTNLATLQ